MALGLAVFASLCARPCAAQEDIDPFVEAFLVENAQYGVEALSAGRVLGQFAVRLQRIDGPVDLLSGDAVVLRGWTVRRGEGWGGVNFFRVRFGDETAARTVFEALRRFGVDERFGLSKAWDHVALVGQEIVWLGVVACGYEDRWRVATDVLSRQLREAGNQPQAVIECHCGSACVDVTAEDP
jgi:hypothetical protein